MEAVGKVLGVLKGLPASMLAALSVAAFLAWVVAPLRAGVPATLRPSLPLLAVLFAAMAVFGAVGNVLTTAQGRLIERKADARQRLVQAYGPLAALFTLRHVTICSGVAAPRFKHRVGIALTELFRYRRPLVGFRRALNALGDRQVSTSAEVEYGGNFPMAEIYAIVGGNPAAAGPTLLNLVRRADRSRCEEQVDSGVLTDEEYALFVYIHHEHERLSAAAA